MQPGTRVRYVAKTAGGVDVRDARGTVHPMPVNRSPNEGRPYIFVEWDLYKNDPHAPLITPYPENMIEALSIVEVLAEIAP